YYSDDYIKIAEKIEKIMWGDSKASKASKDDELGDLFGDLDEVLKLEEQLMNLVYEYIQIDFDSEDKVSSVFFDAQKCDSKEDKKILKSSKVQGNTTIQQYDVLNLTYSVKYTDGSLYKGINKAYADIKNNAIEWADKYGNKFKAEIKVTPITRLTSEIVKIIAGGDKSLLTEFEISSNIEGIDYDAFNGCNNLTTVTMPTWAIDYIPKDNLKNVIINGGDSIGRYAFLNCSSLTSIEIPSSVTSIGERAFHNCSSLTSIKFGENSQLTSIGEDAFYNCSSLTSIAIPSSVTSIGDYAFYNGSNLTSVTFGKKSLLNSIGTWAFANCINLTNIEIPICVTSIGQCAFAYCSNLTIFCESSSKPSEWHINWNHSNLPVVWNYGGEHGETESGIKWGNTRDRMMTIAGYSGTSTEVVIPETINGYQVTCIGERAFYDRSSLTSIEIPSSVTSIGNYALFGCSSLTGIYISDIASWCAIEFGGYYANPLYCAKKLYLNNELVTDLVIPSGVTSIGDSAFSGCSSLTSIEIPNSVTNIGEFTFYGCSSLTSIEIPSSVTSIGSNAFRGCSNLTIYCETESEPSGWEITWNSSNRPVVWGHKIGNK
ncbi:MAG: leucine-rich repeat domain-containing protein, partial [Clostridia bacterium]|nr:leucine-rich repeat domain-containing protein [Clostridia bacterium]